MAKSTYVSSASPQILYFTNGQLYPTGSKAERASLLQNPPTGGVATLKLTDVHPSDTGTYLCHVNNPPDFYSNGLGLINLTVLGEAGWGPTSHPHNPKDCTGPAQSSPILISSPRAQLHWGPRRKMPPSQSPPILPLLHPPQRTPPPSVAPTDRDLSHAPNSSIFGGTSHL